MRRRRITTYIACGPAISPSKNLTIYECEPDTGFKAFVWGILGYPRFRHLIIFSGTRDNLQSILPFHDIYEIVMSQDIQLKECYQ